MLPQFFLMSPYFFFPFILFLPAIPESIVPNYEELRPKISLSREEEVEEGTWTCAESVVGFRSVGGSEERLILGAIFVSIFALAFICV